MNYSLNKKNKRTTLETVTEDSLIATSMLFRPSEASDKSLITYSLHLRKRTLSLDEGRYILIVSIEEIRNQQIFLIIST